MSKKQNTLAKGMFVRQHTFNSGTTVINLSVKPVDFCQFMKDNMTEDSKGNKWVNIRLLPNKNVGDNKLSHTPILNEYTPKTAEQAVQDLAASVLTPSVEERQIVETPETQTAGNTKTLISDLPF